MPDRTQRPSSACWIPPSLVEDLIQSRVARHPWPFSWRPVAPPLCVTGPLRILSVDSYPAPSAPSAIHTALRAIEFDIAYLMELAGESWRVVGYISARDQQEEMQALGLM